MALSTLHTEARSNIHFDAAIQASHITCRRSVVWRESYDTVNGLSSGRSGLRVRDLGSRGLLAHVVARLNHVSEILEVL